MTLDFDTYAGRSNLRNLIERLAQSEKDSASEVASLTLGEARELVMELLTYHTELQAQQEELKQIQHELTQSRDEYQELYDNVPVGYLTLDQSGIIRQVNRACANMLGTTVEHMTYRPLAAFVAPEDAFHFESFLRQAFDIGSANSWETRFLKADGTEINGRIECQSLNRPESHIYIVLSDITELKRVQEALEESEAHLEERVTDRTAKLAQANKDLRAEIERHRETLESLQHSETLLRAVFDSAQDIIFIKDEQLRFVRINPMFERVFQCNANDVVGKTLEQANILKKEAFAAIERANKRVLQGETVEMERTVFVHGVPMVFLEVRVPLRDSDGTVVGLCGTGRDITHWKKVEQRIQPADVEYPSAAMQATLETAGLAAQRDVIVLLQGESGCGKDYLAQWIHRHSPRHGSPFFTVNCATLPAELAETELFGREAGAYTGAASRKRGLVEVAEGGTLLLNEIGELPLALQSKLLIFLDDQQFVRVGGEKSHTADVRVIAATHRNLKEEVARGRFHEALYYRLNVLPIHMPPLRERLDDIPILVKQLFDDLVSNWAVSDVPEIDQACVQGLRAYHWPGNVRELRNCIERALILTKGNRLYLRPPLVEHMDPEIHAGVHEFGGMTLKQAKDETTRMMCLAALKQTDNNKTQAAEMLGVSRDAFYRYLRQFGIKV